MVNTTAAAVTVDKLRITPIRPYYGSLVSAPGVSRHVSLCRRLPRFAALAREFCAIFGTREGMRGEFTSPGYRGTLRACNSRKGYAAVSRAHGCLSQGLSLLNKIDIIFLTPRVLPIKFLALSKQAMLGACACDSLRNAVIAPKSGSYLPWSTTALR